MSKTRNIIATRVTSAGSTIGVSIMISSSGIVVTSTTFTTITSTTRSSIT